MSESLNTQCGHLKSLEEVLENRGDAEDERTCMTALRVMFRPRLMKGSKLIDPIESRQRDASEPGVAVSEGNPAKLLASRHQMGRKWGVLFSLRDLGLQKSMSADVADSSAQHNPPSVLQTQKLSQEWNYRIGSDLSASPTFDIFAFGLIFVQSYLASNSLLPTTYETANEYMAKAYGFNNDHLKSIKEEIKAIGSKEAADLAAMILQPSPMKRAQTFAEILEHDYFNDDSTD